MRCCRGASADRSSWPRMTLPDWSFRTARRTRAPACSRPAEQIGSPSTHKSIVFAAYAGLVVGNCSPPASMLENALDGVPNSATAATRSPTWGGIAGGGHVGDGRALGIATEHHLGVRAAGDDVFDVGPRVVGSARGTAQVVVAGGVVDRIHPDRPRHRPARSARRRRLGRRCRHRAARSCPWRTPPRRPSTAGRQLRRRAGSQRLPPRRPRPRRWRRRGSDSPSHANDLAPPERRGDRARSKPARW